jgi:hypothetical protein
MNRVEGLVLFTEGGGSNPPSDTKARKDLPSETSRSSALEAGVCWELTRFRPAWYRLRYAWRNRARSAGVRSRSARSRARSSS